MDEPEKCEAHKLIPAQCENKPRAKIQGINHEGGVDVEAWLCESCLRGFVMAAKEKGIPSKVFTSEAEMDMQTRRN